MRILLVEDDTNIASFIITGLKDAGYSVDYVQDGESGLHMALNFPYDAAVIDIITEKKIPFCQVGLQADLKLQLFLAAVR